MRSAVYGHHWSKSLFWTKKVLVNVPFSHSFFNLAFLLLSLFLLFQYYVTERYSLEGTNRCKVFT